VLVKANPVWVLAISSKSKGPIGAVASLLLHPIHCTSVSAQIMVKQAIVNLLIWS